jgi:hypothetical protein
MAVRLSAICTGCALLPRNIIFLFLLEAVSVSVRLSKPQGLVWLELLDKLKKISALIGSQIRYLLACRMIFLNINESIRFDFVTVDCSYGR